MCSPLPREELVPCWEKNTISVLTNQDRSKTISISSPIKYCNSGNALPENGCFRKTSDSGYPVFFLF
jgi:hypothetical protein